MKVNVKDLVTVRAWYMPRRQYGRVTGKNRAYVFVQGKFGLEQFHRSQVRVVNAPAASQEAGK